MSLEMESTYTINTYGFIHTDELNLTGMSAQRRVLIYKMVDDNTARATPVKVTHFVLLIFAAAFDGGTCCTLPGRKDFLDANVCKIGRRNADATIIEKELSVIRIPNAHNPM